MQTFRNPLDPLVSALASSYADSSDLAHRLDALFEAGPHLHTYPILFSFSFNLAFLGCLFDSKAGLSGPSDRDRLSLSLFCHLPNPLPPLISLHPPSLATPRRFPPAISVEEIFGLCTNAARCS